MPAQNSPGIIGDEDEIFALEEGISELLEQAHEKRRMRTLSYEAEKSSQYQAFKASVTRANRRAEEAEERLRVVHHQYGETAKIEREQNAVEIDALKEDFQRKLKEMTETADEKLRIALQDGEGVKVEMQQQVDELKALEEGYENERNMQAEQFEEKLRRARQEAAELKREQRDDERKAQDERFEKAWKSQAEAFEKKLRIAHQSSEAAKLEREQRANEIKALENNFERERKAQDELHSQKAEAQQRRIEDQLRTMKLKQVELEGTAKTYQREIAALKAQLQGAENNARSPEHEERLHANIADLQKQLSAKEEQSEAHDKSRLNRSKGKVRIQQAMLATAEILAKAELRHGKLSASLLRLDEDLDDMGMKAIRKAVGQLRLETKVIEEGLSQAKQSVTAANERLNTLEDSVNREDGPLPTNGDANHNVSTG